MFKNSLKFLKTPFPNIGPPAVVTVDPPSCSFTVSVNGRLLVGLALTRTEGRADGGWTGGRVDGRKDERTGGRPKGGRTEGRADGRVDGQKEGIFFDF